MDITTRPDTNRQGPDDPALPGEQPEIEQVPPIDDAPVPPLTAPDDTQGG